MGVLIYFLCALTALLCAWLLLKAYRNSGYKLLLWGGLCFVGLTLNNVLVIVDKFVFPYADLSTWRLILALASALIFLYGLIWDSEWGKFYESITARRNSDGKFGNRIVLSAFLEKNARPFLSLFRNCLLFGRIKQSLVGLAPKFQRAWAGFIFGQTLVIRPYSNCHCG